MTPDAARALAERIVDEFVRWKARPGTDERRGLVVLIARILEAE